MTNESDDSLVNSCRDLIHERWSELTVQEHRSPLLQLLNKTADEKEAVSVCARIISEIDRIGGDASQLISAFVMDVENVRAGLIDLFASETVRIVKKHEKGDIRRIVVAKRTILDLMQKIEPNIDWDDGHWKEYFQKCAGIHLPKCANGLNHLRQYLAGYHKLEQAGEWPEFWEYALGDEEAGDWKDFVDCVAMERMNSEVRKKGFAEKDFKFAHNVMTWYWALEPANGLLEMSKVAKQLPKKSGAEKGKGGKKPGPSGAGGKDPQSRIRSRSLSGQSDGGIESGGREGNVKKTRIAMDDASAHSPSTQPVRLRQSRALPLLRLGKTIDLRKRFHPMPTTALPCIVLKPTLPPNCWRVDTSPHRDAAGYSGPRTIISPWDKASTTPEELSASRSIDLYIVRDSNKGIEPCTLNVPPFAGSPGLVKLLQENLLHSDNPSGTIAVLPDLRSMNDEEIATWFGSAGKWNAVHLPKGVSDGDGPEDASLEAVLRFLNLSPDTKFKYQNGVYSGDYLKGEVVYKRPRPELPHRDAMAPWEQALTDQGEMERRLALSCLEGTTYHKTMPALANPLNSQMKTMKTSAEALDSRPRNYPAEFADLIDRIWPTYVGQMDPDDEPRATDQPLPFYSNIHDSPSAPNSMERDFGRLLQWLLDSSAGSFSDWHCDAAGGLTIVRILSGQKLWIIETVGESEDEHPAARHIDVLLLSAGDILIMRPGVKHSVYTVQNSLATGSHFYSMAVLEESLYARFREASSRQAATNECLPIGHAVMVYYGLKLTDERFDPADYSIDEDTAARLRDLIHQSLRTSIFAQIQWPTEPEERQTLVDVLSCIRHQAGLLLSRLAEFEE